MSLLSSVSFHCHISLLQLVKLRCQTIFRHIINDNDDDDDDDYDDNDDDNGDDYVSESDNNMILILIDLTPELML